MSDAAIVYVDDQGRAVYRASGLYGCEKALLLSRLGYEAVAPNAKMQKAFDEGHFHEPLILSRLQSEYEIDLYSFQETVEIPIGSKALIRGHIDALGTASALGNIWITHRNGEAVESHGKGRAPFAIPGPFIIDAKAFAQSTWNRWSAGGLASMRYYAWQGAIYSKALDDLPFVLAIKNKATDQMRVEWYDPEYLQDFTPFNEIVSKIMRVEAMAAKGEPAIPQQCNYEGVPGRTNYICGFWPYHEDVPAEKTPDDEMVGDQSEARTLAGIYQAAALDEKNATARKKSAATKLLGLMGNEPASLKLDDVTISAYYAGYSTTDKERLAADYPELDLDSYKTTTKSDRLSVRVTAKEAK